MRGWYTRRFPGVHRIITNATRVIVPEWSLHGPAAAASKNQENFIAPVSYKAKSENIVHALVLVVWEWIQKE